MQENKKVTTLSGTVIANRAGSPFIKGSKTRPVLIWSTVRHRYGKVIRRKLRLLVHDEEEKSMLGDEVLIQSCKPVSKLKRWKIIEVLSRKDQGEMV